MAKEISKIKVGGIVYEIKPTSYDLTTETIGSASAGTTIPADDITRDRKSTRLNSSHDRQSRMPSSA